MFLNFKTLKSKSIITYLNFGGTLVSQPKFFFITIFIFFQTFVPTDAKDGDYWAKRDKNNFAARRSREARRLKENQIALRTAFLEKENHQLKVRTKNKDI